VPEALNARRLARDACNRRAAQHSADHQREMIRDVVRITRLLFLDAQRDAWRLMLSRDCRRMFLSVAQNFRSAKNVT
jgi:hypothetical protein